MSLRTFVRRNMKALCASIALLLCLSSYSRKMLRYAAPVDRYFEYSTREKDAPIRDFVVDTPGCRIPNLDPFDETIRAFIGQSKPIRCSAAPQLTYIERATLSVNQSALAMHYHNDLDHCFHRGMSRLAGASENAYSVKEESGKFKDNVEVTSDFMHVVCYDSKGNSIYSNYHAAVFKRDDVEKNCDAKYTAFNRKKKLKENLNILMVGVESVSRLNFVRQMVRTRRYLTEEMAAVELQGYNALAGGTDANLVPLLTGKLVEDLSLGDRSDPKSVHQFDSIWKNVSSRGYRTLYATDTPLSSIFDGSVEGSFSTASDYYMCPLCLDTRQRSAVKNLLNCIGNRLETEVMTDYVKDFVTLFRDKPTFAFTFISGLTRYDINKAGNADAIYHQFISSLHQQRLLENTLLIFFSDHGMRFGEIKDTFIGTMEERLPFMYLAFPKWFYTKYPLFELNMRINQRRLTTPFDIHETLVDILNFEGIASTSGMNSSGTSLLSEISTTRTCESAGIPPHWCTCLLQEIPTNGTEVARIADEAVRLINNELKPHQHVCTTLFRSNITGARLVVSKPLDKSTGIYQTPQNNYLVTFQTKPGNGLFEVTVPYAREEHDSKDANKVLGNIRRIDDFSKQPTCIRSKQLAKFCSCY